MKSVAQTIIEADRFYTIAAKTGNVIQAVESVKDGGNIRLGKYEHKPEQEWAFVREGDGVYRIRNRASGKLIDLMMTGTANGTWLHLWAFLSRSSSNRRGRAAASTCRVSSRAVTKPIWLTSSTVGTSRLARLSSARRTTSACSAAPTAPMHSRPIWLISEKVWLSRLGRQICSV